MADKKKHPREGDERLSGSSTDGPRRGGGRDKPATKQPARNAAGKDGSRPKPATDVGRALRSVYDSTLREEVPQDFLDLLGRLD